jgi:hypothetical protein
MAKLRMKDYDTGNEAQSGGIRRGHLASDQMLVLCAATLKKLFPDEFRNWLNDYREQPERDTEDEE